MGNFDFFKETRAAAERLYSARESLTSFPQVKYIMQGFGDLDDPTYNDGYKAGLHNPLEFESLAAALWFLETWAVEISDGEKELKLDPEDDRVLIWEVLPDGHRKVVWHFSGWHWDADEFGLPQGKFLGHKKSVYEECGF